MIIAGNWKMNLEKNEALQLVKDIASEEVHPDIQVKIAVPFVYLDNLREVVSEQSNFSIGAQNIHQALSGAYTGEISAKMVKSCGIDWTLLGHSERRQFFDETSDLVQEKCKVALQEKLKVIICVGEPQSVRENGNQKEFVKTQLDKSIPKDLETSEIPRIIIAYEPVWAIGTGLTASPEQAQDMHHYIRDILCQRFGSSGNKIPILYGGSMKPQNAHGLLSQDDIDGGLIGGASLKSASFLQIIRIAEGLKK